MTINEQLLALRKFRGMTAKELARRAGIPQTQLCVIERGRSRPRTDTIEALAEALDCDIRILPRRL